MFCVLIISCENFLILLYYTTGLSKHYINTEQAVCVTLAESLRLSLRNLRDILDTYEIEEVALSNST